MRIFASEARTWNRSSSRVAAAPRPSALATLCRWMGLPGSRAYAADFQLGPFASCSAGAAVACAAVQQSHRAVAIEKIRMGGPLLFVKSAIISGGLLPRFGNYVRSGISRQAGNSSRERARRKRDFSVFQPIQLPDVDQHLVQRRLGLLPGARLGQSADGIDDGD